MFYNICVGLFMVSTLFLVNYLNYMMVRDDRRHEKTRKQELKIVGKHNQQ